MNQFHLIHFQLKYGRMRCQKLEDACYQVICSMETSFAILFILILTSVGHSFVDLKRHHVRIFVLECHSLLMPQPEESKERRFAFNCWFNSCGLRLVDFHFPLKNRFYPRIQAIVNCPAVIASLQCMSVWSQTVDRDLITTLMRRPTVTWLCISTKSVHDFPHAYPCTQRLSSLLPAQFSPYFFPIFKIKLLGVL